MRRVAPLLVLVLLAGCSSSHDKKDTAAAGTTASPSTAASAATGPTPTTAASTAATSRPGASAGATTSAGAGTGTGGGARPSTSSAPAHQAVTGIPAGTYTYDSSGSQTSTPGGKQAVSNTSSLTVTEVIDGSQTSTLHNSQGDTTQSLLVRDNGSYLQSLSVKGPGIDTEFDFNPAALLFGLPARIGATWTWGGTSNDGSTKVRASNKVLRTETVTIGGEKVPTVVLQTHLVITGKDFSYTADTTNWVDPALRLPVKTRTVGTGKYGFITFSFDVTDVLRSVHAA